MAAHIAGPPLLTALAREISETISAAEGSREVSDKWALQNRKAVCERDDAKAELDTEKAAHDQTRRELAELRKQMQGPPGAAASSADAGRPPPERGVVVGAGGRAADAQLLSSEAATGRSGYSGSPRPSASNVPQELPPSLRSEVPSGVPPQGLVIASGSRAQPEQLPGSQLSELCHLRGQPLQSIAALPMRRFEHLAAVSTPQQKAPAGTIQPPPDVQRLAQRVGADVWETTVYGPITKPQKKDPVYQAECVVALAGGRQERLKGGFHPRKEGALKKLWEHHVCQLLKEQQPLLREHQPEPSDYESSVSGSLAHVRLPS